MIHSSLHSLHFALRTAVAASLVLGTALAQDANPPRLSVSPPPGTSLSGPPTSARGPVPLGPQPDYELVKQFDQDRDGRLNLKERREAREFLAAEKAAGRGPRRPGFGRRQETPEPVTPGPKLSPQDVPAAPGTPLYDLRTVRTLFLEFGEPDWEKELSEFYHTDVDIPAQLTVDGKVYPDVGVHFRGASSFFTVSEGRKRSLNLSLDYAHQEQLLRGQRTLQLLNAHGDPTFLRSVLYSHIAGQYLPAPKANFVRLAINGESWGIYVNAQPVNRDFLQEHFGTRNGARWKVPGNPRARGGLEYLGEEVEPYKRHYEIKSKDDPKSWQEFIRLCRTLEQTPIEKLEAALAPLLDMEGVLKFLALENVFINNDGYWIRSSDFYIYQDPKGRFHLIPHDTNETFQSAVGGGTGVELDPLAGANDKSKPLLAKLLSVPSLRTRYLQTVRAMAEEWLDWSRLSTMASELQRLIAEDVKNDTRKEYSLAGFTSGLDTDVVRQTPRGPYTSLSLKSFVEKRRAYLLEHPEIKALPR